MKLDASRFNLGRYFEGLEFNQIQEAIDDVYVWLYGAIETSYEIMEPKIRDAKREQIWQYATAWKLANDYPENVIGMMQNPMMPISSKKIKNISLTFKDVVRQQGGLEILQNNPFGMQALVRILAAPENYMFRA
jgi:hypothetical protein